MLHSLFEINLNQAWLITIFFHIWSMMHWLQWRYIIITAVNFIVWNLCLNLCQAWLISIFFTLGQWCIDYYAGRLSSQQGIWLFEIKLSQAWLISMFLYLINGTWITMKIDSHKNRKLEMVYDLNLADNIRIISWISWEKDIITSLSLNALLE